MKTSSTCGALGLAVLLALAPGALAFATASSPGPAPPRALGAAPRSKAAKAPARQDGSENVFTMLYGDDHCFGLVAPKGWVIDDSSGLGSKIRVVLYKRGQKWMTAGTVMYVNPIHQDPKNPRPLKLVIGKDVEAFMQNSPRGKVTSAPNVRTAGGKVAEVRLFSREGGKPQEAVAYVPEDDLVMLLVLSSREVGGLEEAMPAFRDVVASYKFVAGAIQTPTR